jgi:hypothetical protein
MKTTKSKRGKFTIIILLRLPVQSLDDWASETIVPDARKKMKNPGKFECYVVRNDEKFCGKNKQQQQPKYTRPLLCDVRNSMVFVVL